MWAIQVSINRTHLWFVGYDEKFSADPNKAMLFDTEKAAKTAIEWDGCLGSKHTRIKMDDPSLLRNRFPLHTFKPVNVLIVQEKIHESSLRYFVNSRQFFDIGGGVHISNCGNHSYVEA